MTVYRVTTVGDMYGQEIRNNFYYRLGVGVDANLLPFIGCKSICEEFEQEILNSLQDVLHQDFEFRYLEADVLESTFSVVLSQPYRHDLNGKSGRVTGDSLGPASYIYMRANLEPMLMIEGLIAPKKGGVMVGPIAEGWVDGGRLTAAFWQGAETEFETLANKLAQDLQAIDPPAVFYPVRARINRGLGGLITLVGTADILSWSVDDRLKMLRSRQYER